MELGNIPKIDQFKDNKAVEMQQVKSTSNLAKTDEQRELKEIQKKSIDQAKENSDVQKAQNESASKSKYEVVLSNTNFGFNSSSQDFFVRVERGNSENQYPTEGYRTAEVTLGGVDTSEVSSKTMESKKQKGLYFIGEVLDVTGHLGGYNFQWAWSSAQAAAQFV
jgi:predicted flavoprotein YhiN